LQQLQQRGKDRQRHVQKQRLAETKGSSSGPCCDRDGTGGRGTARRNDWKNPTVGRSSELQKLQLSRGREGVHAIDIIVHGLDYRIPSRNRSSVGIFRS
ncbi:hypothetical protein PENTCL1PPCAC_8975, partial [Pristionchus entomophagus]